MWWIYTEEKKIACLRHLRLCCHANDHIANLVYTQKAHYYKGSTESTHKKYTKTSVLCLTEEIYKKWKGMLAIYSKAWFNSVTPVAKYCLHIVHELL